MGEGTGIWKVSLGFTGAVTFHDLCRASQTSGCTSDPLWVCCSWSSGSVDCVRPHSGCYVVKKCITKKDEFGWVSKGT